MLSKLCRLDKLPDKYKARAEYEIDVIEKLGFADYFMTARDIVLWARRQGITVGVGRGSVGGSLVARLLGITKIDPIRHGLIFERFLNPHRVSPPDIDIDVQSDRRSEVVQHLKEEYGEENIAYIGTFGRIRLKTAVRDAARYLKIDVVDVDAAMSELKWTDTLDSSPPSFRRFLTKHSSLRKFIVALIDKPRHVSVHASGIVISKDRPLIESLPLRVVDGDLVTQWDMGDVEAAGFLKMDVLGVTALTVINRTLDRVKMPFNALCNVSLEDKEVYKLIRRGNLCGVYQLQAAGSAGAARRVAPRSFSELVNVVALYRPVSKSEVETYCFNKMNGWKPIHPIVGEVLSDTNGILIYQEQAMQLANKMADFSIAEADELRKIIGKKIKDDALLSRMHDRFMRVAAKKTSPATAKTVWRWLEVARDYAFCKAHATAYGMTAYLMAWLKCYHYKEFMVEHMGQETMNVDKMVSSHSELKNMGVALLRPVYGLSKAEDFVITDTGIIMPYVVIKGIGTTMAEKIEKSAVVLEKQIGRISVDTIKTLLKTKTLTPKPVELLITSGSLDFLDESREKLMSVLLGKEVTWDKTHYLALEAKALGFAL